MEKLYSFSEFIGEAEMHSELNASKLHFLKQSVKGAWKMNSKGEIDVSGNVTCSKLLSGIPVQFGVVAGDFDCSGWKKLTSLKGSPRKVGGTFDCSYNENLVTLEGGPEEVVNFRGIGIGVKTLKGSPKIVKGYYYCQYSDSLESLEGAPRKVLSFNAAHCKLLVDLKGGPDEVFHAYNCTHCNNLKTLEGCPTEIGHLFQCGNAPYEESLPQEQIELSKDIELLCTWAKSGYPPIPEFLHKKRGTIKGKEFGF